MAGKGSAAPTPVAALLSGALPGGAERLLEARIRRDWRQLVGPEIARRCQPAELRNRTLELTVDNSPWLQELALREAELLGRLNQRYGADAVRAIKVSLGALAREPAAYDRRRAGKPDRPTGEEMQMIDAAVTLITAPELQRLARRLFERACVAARVRRGAT